MFTKSGSKLVRISIPNTTDQPPSNGDKKQLNQVNGHINSILDDLVSRGCTVTAIAENTAKQTRNNITPSSKRRRATKVGSSSQTLAGVSCISSNDVLSPQRKPQLVSVQKKNERPILNAHSKPVRNRTHNDEPRDKVFTAFKAKNTPTAAPTGQLLEKLQIHKKTLSAELSPEKQSLAEKYESSSAGIHFSRYINGTKYVCFTPQSDVVKRERLIQVNENEIKNTLETAVQCDLSEGESSSESSQSDWINEIIEEYEYLEEDGDMFECNVCGEVCRSHLSNLKHSMTHKESSLLCFRCGRLFPNTSKLLAHEEKMHTEDNLTIKKALRCPKLNCLKAFHSERQLFDHIDQHTTRVTEQRCRKCQRSFPSSLQLLSHVNRRNCWR